MVLTWLPLLALVCRFWRADHDFWMDEISRALAGIEQRCRAGAVDWLPAGDAPSVISEALAAPVEAAWQDGLPLAASLEALRGELQHASELARSGRMLLRLWIGRLLVAWTSATGARWLLGVPFDAVESPLQHLDLTCLVLASILLAGGPWLLHRYLPPPWLGRDGPGAAACAWLEAHLGVGPGAGLAVAPALAELAAHELTVGVSRAGERRALLAAWAREQTSLDRRRLQGVVEALPLLELATIGLPIALALAAPLLRCFS